MLNQGSFFIIQRNGETAALFGLAAQRNLTAVPFDNPSHDGQTQTGTFFVFSVFFNLVKSPPDIFLFALRYADTVILYGDDDLFASMVQFNPYMSTCIAVLNSVVQQIEKHADHEQFITYEVYFGLDMTDDLNVLFGCFGLDFKGKIMYQLRKVYRFHTGR